MNIEEIRQSLFSLLKEKVNTSNRNVLVFGTGRLSAEIFEYGDIDVNAFVDNNTDKQGKEFFGRKIISFNEISGYNNPIILIAVADIDAYREIKSLLDENNYESYHIEEYLFRENGDKIMEVFDSLNDDKSKEIYANVICARMFLKDLDLKLVSSNQYFDVRGFKDMRTDEVLIDCGAFVGDTIEEYLKVKYGCFKKIYAFEPVQKLYDAAKHRIERLKKEWALSDDQIILINAGTGEKTSKLRFECEKPAAGRFLEENNANSDDVIDVYSLDDYFSDKEATFIKADIEGFEEKMLNGAEKIIKRDKPRIAVCIYHSYHDMYQIPMLIKEMDPTYKLSVRHHADTFCETVLYAY